MSQEYLGSAYAWQDQDQWFHSPTAAEAPPGSTEVERFLEGGEIILYADGNMIRGAKPWLASVA